MELSGKGFGEGARSGSRPDSGGADMAVTTLVSQSTGTTECNPSENRLSRGSNSASGGSRSRGNPALSHVAYLRQHNTSQRLSGEVTAALQSSWRKKSSQSYDSITACVRNGSAGIVNGRLIQFQILWSYRWSQGAWPLLVSLLPLLFPSPLWSDTSLKSSSSEKGKTRVSPLCPFAPCECGLISVVSRCNSAPQCLQCLCFLASEIELEWE